VGEITDTVSQSAVTSIRIGLNAKLPLNTRFTSHTQNRIIMTEPGIFADTNRNRTMKTLYLLTTLWTTILYRPCITATLFNRTSNLMIGP
jgi:hypothetical protein